MLIQPEFVWNLKSSDFVLLYTFQTFATQNTEKPAQLQNRTSLAQVGRASATRCKSLMRSAVWMLLLYVCIFCCLYFKMISFQVYLFLHVTYLCVSCFDCVIKLMGQKGPSTPLTPVRKGTFCSLVWKLPWHWKMGEDHQNQHVFEKLGRKYYHAFKYLV